MVKFLIMLENSQDSQVGDDEVGIAVAKDLHSFF